MLVDLALPLGSRRHWARRACVAGVLLSCALPGRLLAQAVGPSGADAAGASRSFDAKAWLLRVQEAAKLRNYEGMMVSSDGGAVSVWRVAHYIEADQQYERVDAMGGEPLMVLRQNDVVHKVWLQSRQAEVEQRNGRPEALAQPTLVDQRIVESYDVRPVGLARVAGREVEVVEIRARDTLRFSQRLWVDRQTGLLLRADILGPGGQVLDWSAFSEVAIGVKPRSALITDRLRHLEGFKVRRLALLPTRLESEGWQVGAGIPAGFKPVQCAKRTLDSEGDASEPVVLQAIFSDGLTYVSLFVEPFDPKRHQVEFMGAIGATHTWRTRRDDQWVTAMGDVPTETLKRFVGALERRR